MKGRAYSRYLHDWLLQEGIVPGTILSVASYLAILACVSAGTGCAVVPQAVLSGEHGLANRFHANADEARYPSEDPRDINLRCRAGVAERTAAILPRGRNFQ